MKSNSSWNPLQFEFTLFADYGPYQYLFFCLALLVYMIIISANAVIFLAVCLDRSLHQPMYIFICSLSLNALYGSAAFFPRFLQDILSDTHFISYPSCFLQMYIIHSFKGHEMTIITVMAYDRFVAIFYPLHYQSKMTLKRVRYLLILAALSPVCVFGIFLYLGSRLPLCGNKLHKYFCTIWGVVQLSCVDTSRLTTASLLVVVIWLFLLMFFVMYTYLRILIMCSKSSPEFRRKALQTCLPHIVTFGNFCIAIFCDFSFSLYKLHEVNVFVIVLSLEFLIIPPISNPLLYGLSLPQIKGAIVKCVKVCKIIPAPKPTTQHAQITMNQAMQV